MPNTLYYGDNLAVLREYVPDESVDLVYLAPPFNSNATCNVLFRERTGVEADFWFGVHHARWADTADSPLWVGTNKRDLVNMDDAGSELNRPVRDGWLPIYPKLGVEYPEVLDDVVSQLKAVHKALLEQP